MENPLIKLDKDSLSINVKHVSDELHISIHQDFFDIFEQWSSSILTLNFWAKKDEIFKEKIIFCDEVKKQIMNIDTVIFSQALSILRNIENETKCLTDFAISSESESVKENPRLKN